MKKYEYAEIKYQEKGILFSNTTEHRKLIDEYAKKGFQYIGSKKGKILMMQFISIFKEEL